jgi:hypothetical protein
MRASRTARRTASVARTRSAVALAAVALAAVALAAAGAAAQPPPVAIPPAVPLYSIAAGSPSPFLPSDILAANPLGGPALVAIPSAAFGLLPTDDIDAIAYRRPNAYPLYFSVDRTSTGVTGLPGSPAPTAVAIQASLGQAAGDIFMTGFPARIPGPGYIPLPPAGTNFLIRNQDELGLLPNVSQGDPVTTPIDELDALELFYIQDGQPTIANLFYSLAPGSPTLALLGATPGDLITTIGGIPTLVPFFRQLVGLLPDDDLDGLAMDSVSGGIGFSLTRNSPSLGFQPWRASDVLYVNPGGPTPGQVFTALDFGFIGIAPTDELDAIAFPKPDPPPPPDCSIQILNGVILLPDGTVIDGRACPFTPAFIPEPGSIWLLVTGLGLIGLLAALGRARAGRLH